MSVDILKKFHIKTAKQSFLMIAYKKVNGAVFLTHVKKRMAAHSPREWVGELWNIPALLQAHIFIQHNFDSLDTDSVVDVDFITGNARDLRL